LASSIARGRVRLTIATELPNMAAILKKKHAALVSFTVYFFDIGHTMLIDTFQNKVSADQ